MAKSGTISELEEAFAAIITNTFLSQKMLTETKCHRVNQKPSREVVMIILKCFLSKTRVV